MQPGSWDHPRELRPDRPQWATIAAAPRPLHHQPRVSSTRDSSTTAARLGSTCRWPQSWSVKAPALHTTPVTTAARTYELPYAAMDRSRGRLKVVRAAKPGDGCVYLGPFGSSGPARLAKEALEDVARTRGFED